MTTEERLALLRKTYRESDIFTQYLGYTRVRRQRLNFMRAYVNNPHGAFSARLRRAYAEAYLLENMAPVIHPGERIVGLPDISPLTEEEQEEYRELEKAMRAAPDTGPLTIGHMALDYPKLLHVGVSGLLKEIRGRRAALDKNEPESLPKEEFYEGCEAELEALGTLAAHYRDYARELAGKESDPDRKRELEEIADNLSVVPMEPAKTFHQALQCLHFYNFCLWELYYFGRVDRYLEPYYTADLAAGRLSREEAVELFACFLLLPDAYIMPGIAIDSLIGGRGPDGKAVENEVTFLVLDAIAAAHSANGKAAVAVTSDTGEELLRRVIRLNAAGYTQPAIFNDALITEGFLKLGLPPEDARDYCHTGCVEVTPIGKSGSYVVAPYHNLPQYLLDTLATSPDGEEEEAFLARFEKTVRERVIEENDKINRRMLKRSRNGCECMRASCLVHDCLETGRSLDEGGARYNYTEPNFLGFSNTVDSLVTLHELVFSGKMTGKELLAVLGSDYGGEEGEALRLFILNKLPHYGNNEESTDRTALRLSEMLVRCCSGIKNQRGVAPLLPGAFSYLEHARYGAVTGATPDGRHAGYPLASGSSPVQGREKSGPTAAMLSSTEWEHRDFMGGIAVNMKFSPGQMSGENEDRMLAFIRAFLERGGFQLQFNCVSRETLLAAREHPEEYSNLLVRVGGFSAYFCKISPAMQQEIIDRNEHSF